MVKFTTHLFAFRFFIQNVRPFLQKNNSSSHVELCHSRDTGESGKQISGLLHPPILKKQLYMFSLFDIGANNRCHLHHIDSLTFF